MNKEKLILIFFGKLKNILALYQFTWFLKKRMYTDLYLLNAKKSSFDN